MDESSDGVDDAARLGTSSLLLAPSDTEGAANACHSLATPSGRQGDRVLLVTTRQSAADRLDGWVEHTDHPESAVSVVSVGEVTRSTAAASPSATRPNPDQCGVRVDSVSDPSDLTGLGRAIARYLDACDEDDVQPVACVDSLGPLIDAAGAGAVAHFLALLTRSFTRRGGTVHAHLDPEAYPSDAVDTLSLVFDVLVVPRGDSEWAVEDLPAQSEPPDRANDPHEDADDRRTDTYDWTESLYNPRLESTSETLLQVVAAHTGRMPDALPPLGAVVNADALDTLISHASRAGPDPNPLVISFRYAGCVVRVDSRGLVAVSRTAAERGPSDEP